jgi:hypothetical protein
MPSIISEEGRVVEVHQKHDSLNTFLQSNRLGRHAKSMQDETRTEVSFLTKILQGFSELGKMINLRCSSS